MVLLYDKFDSYCGIELLTELYNIYNLVLNNFNKINRNLAKKISFINKNFFDLDLSKFNIIFMRYPTKHAEELYLQLEEKIVNELAKNTLIISVIRKLKNIYIFLLIDKQTIEADYWESAIYYHLKYK